MCCCFDDEISFGNAVRSPSILRRGISMNCRETSGLVPLLDRIDADNTTCYMICKFGELKYDLDEIEF